MNRGQRWDLNRYDKNARFVTDLGQPVVDMLAPRPNERILDLGCGDGVLTKKLMDMGCEVVGVDSSPEFVAAAKLLGVDAHLVDGQHLKFEHEFDAVFSNAALHWMKDDPAKVLRGVHKALKPTGRFAAEMGGQGNVATIVGALHMALKARRVDPAPVDPWYFPAHAEYRALLEKNGFKVKQIGLITRPTPLPADLMGWLETFAGSFTAVLPQPKRTAYLEEVRELLKPQIYNAESKQWIADYVRLRFVAVPVAE